MNTSSLKTDAYTELATLLSDGMDWNQAVRCIKQRIAARDAVSTASASTGAST